MSENENRDAGSQVVRGLEGVVAAETDISYVDGVNADLYYKGYNIHDIADTCTWKWRFFCSTAICPRESRSRNAAFRPSLKCGSPRRS